MESSTSHQSNRQLALDNFTKIITSPFIKSSLDDEPFSAASLNKFIKEITKHY